jgi:D-inositol-3-phosphate glycosyltransferase
MNVYVREVARGLGALGITVDIFTRRVDPALPEVDEFAPGARVLQITAGPPERVEKEEMAALTAPFADGIEAFRSREGVSYDVIHSHYWLSAAAGERLAVLWGVPHAAMFHTLGDVKLRARASEHEREDRLETERRLVHSLDRVVAATEHERRLLQQIYRVPARQVAVIPLGVDLDRFRPAEQSAARARLGIPLEERVILAVGRIEPLKGLDILIRSLADLSDRTGVVLYIIGGDDRAEAEVARLRLVAEQTGVSDAVRFLGPRPHEVLPDFYAAADVVAVPSFYESFGLVAVEAMASGVPVVASRVGGLASTVADGRTGYLIPWRCPTPFAEKIEVLLRNEELRRALGAGARRRMEQGYAWSAVARSVAALYEELIAEGAVPSVASAAS